MPAIGLNKPLQASVTNCRSKDYENRTEKCTKSSLKNIYKSTRLLHGKNYMRVIQLAAELAPIAKVGGLGEVIQGLSKELLRSGVDVQIILPRYTALLNHNLILDRHESFSSMGLTHRAWHTEVDGCPVVLIEPNETYDFFQREKIYGYPDDAARFLLFTRLALAYLALHGQAIDILHVHDWHTASATFIIREEKLCPHIGHVLLTIHNLEYQGHAATWDLDRVGLKGASYLTSSKLEDPVLKGTINILKGGLVYADAINAVSKNYAEEILRPEYGFHLDKTLTRYKNKLTGITNGIDADRWNPESDTALPQQYTNSSSIQTILRAKDEAKQVIAKRFNKPMSARPWIGAITRLVPQKGPELLEAAIEFAIRERMAFVLLGSSPIPSMQHHFETIQRTYQSNPNVLLHFEYDDNLAHLLYAAFDMLLVPSHFEPCGLTQLIAMRYGTIPIVRATGGLKDTVFDCQNPLTPREMRNGFVFDEPTATAMNEAIGRARQMYAEEQAAWGALCQKAMRIDSSWRAPAKRYVETYRSLISSRQTRPERAAYTKLSQTDL
ncbi:MAG: hypothetical protein RL235_1069 [Chlamydiota bacterium]|jgi:starch synthase